MRLQEVDFSSSIPRSTYTQEQQPPQEDPTKSQIGDTEEIYIYVILREFQIDKEFNRKEFTIQGIHKIILSRN